MARWFLRARPFDVRYVAATPFDADAPTASRPSVQQVWFKTVIPLPDDWRWHYSVATYASDMTVLDAALMRHGMRWTDRAVMGASLDHAVWFHAPFRADEWLYFEEDSPVAYGGRGMARALVWNEHGQLVMTVVQEALLRPPGNGAAARPGRGKS